MMRWRKFWHVGGEGKIDLFCILEGKLIKKTSKILYNLSLHKTSKFIELYTNDLGVITSFMNYYTETYQLQTSFNKENLLISIWLIKELLALLGSTTFTILSRKQHYISTHPFIINDTITIFTNKITLKPFHLNYVLI